MPPNTRVEPPRAWVVERSETKRPRLTRQPLGGAILTNQYLETAQ